MAANSVADPEQALCNAIVRFKADPERFARFCWADQGFRPRTWQARLMMDVRDHLSNPETRFQVFRAAVASGHGIGKSALVAIIINWAMSTCPRARVLVTANTAGQLATKTVPEVSKWFSTAINQHWWDVKSETIKPRDTKDKQWMTEFTPWSEYNTEAFQGLHNKGKRILLVFDEASAIADKVWEVAEGAMTDENTEILWLAFGNPTRNTGRFRECFAGGRFAHRWKSYHIDSRTVEDAANKDYLNQLVQDWGEDSDFTRIRVKGEFPRSGSNQLISSDLVDAARKYKAQAYESLPKILGVDVARQGDDRTVIVLRQGRKSQILGKYRGLDNVQVAERAIEFIQKQHPDATVVDGDGIGTGVVDQMKHRNFPCFEFHGGATANDAAAYANRRAEVWGLMRDWLKAGAEIPDDPEMAQDLTAPEYGFNNKGHLQLERKEDMKKRGLASPDCGDALAMTFAVTVLPKPAQAKAPVRYWTPGQQSDSWMGM